MSIRWRWNVFNPRLAFHTCSVLLLDPSCARGKIQCVRCDQFLALRWLPLGALPRRDVSNVHGVDLLKRTALVLLEEEVNDGYRDERAGGEDVSVLEVDGASDEGREEGDEEVPGPVGGRCDTHTHGTVARWVELSDHDPDNWSPRL